MKPDFLDADEEPLTPGWIPEGWEKGEPLEFRKNLYQFTFWRCVLTPYTPQNEIDAQVNEVVYHFDNSRLRDFFTWQEWWNDD